MKNSTMRWIMITAAALVAVGSASAQSYQAEIPMAFRVGKTLMQPGSYQIRVATGAVNKIFVRNNETNQAVVVLPQAPSDVTKAWQREGNPKLAFECGRNTCSLTQFWDATASSTYNFHVEKLPAMEAASIERVTLAAIKVR